MARVLIVEDEEALGLLLRYNLESEGYEVEVCPRGDDADTRLAWLRGNAADVTRGIIRSNSPDPAATWEILRPAL